MANYKVTYHMTQFNLGWRYIFYSSGADAKGVADAAFANRNKLVALHNNNVLLSSIHAANVDATDRDFYKINTEDSTQSNRFIAGAPDVSQTSALYTLRSETTRSRKIWLRGLRDDAVIRSDGTGASRPSPAFTRRVTAFVVSLATNNYQMRYIESPTPATAFAWKDVTSIEEEPGSNGAFTIVTCRVPHGITLGQQVVFSFDNKEILLLGFKGYHTPVSVEVDQDNTKLVVPVTFRSKTSPFLPHRMRVRLAQWNFAPLQGTYDFIRFRSRDTGRAPGPRGRDAGVSFR